MSPQALADALLWDYESAVDAGIPPKLVCFDTLGRWLRGFDFNDYSQVNAATEPLLRVASELKDDGCIVLLLHHQRKGGGRGTDGSLGSQALSGAVDTHCGLTIKSADSENSGAQHPIPPWHWRVGQLRGNRAYLARWRVPRHIFGPGGRGIHGPRVYAGAAGRGNPEGNPGSPGPGPESAIPSLYGTGKGVGVDHHGQDQQDSLSPSRTSSKTYLIPYR